MAEDASQVTEPTSQDAPPAEPEPEAPPAPAPAVPRARRPVRQAAPAAPVAPDKSAALEALGFDEDTLAAFEKWRVDRDSKLPEFDRLKSDYKKTARQLEDARQQIAAFDKQFAELAEQNFALHLGQFAANLGREIKLVAGPMASQDLYSLLHNNVHTEGEGDAVKMVFREGEVEIDLDDREVMKKFQEHIAATRPHWIASQLAQGGGGVGRGVNVSHKNQPPQSSDELAELMFQRVMKGGNSTAPRR